MATAARPDAIEDTRVTVKEKPGEAKGARTDQSRKNRAGARTDPDIDTLLHRFDKGIAREHVAMDRLLERMTSRLPR